MGSINNREHGESGMRYRSYNVQLPTCPSVCGGRRIPTKATERLCENVIDKGLGLELHLKIVAVTTESSHEPCIVQH